MCRTEYIYYAGKVIVSDRLHRREKERGTTSRCMKSMEFRILHDQAETRLLYRQHK